MVERMQVKKANGIYTASITIYDSIFYPLGITKAAVGNTGLEAIKNLKYVLHNSTKGEVAKEIENNL